MPPTQDAQRPDGTRRGEVARACSICGAESVTIGRVVRGAPILHCARCGCDFRPAPSGGTSLAPQVLATQAEAFGAHYARARLTIGPWLRIEARRSLRAVRRIAPPPGHVVEIGCATGELLECARRIGYSVEGLEMSASAAAFARSEYGLDVHASTLESMARRADQCDVVIAIHTLEHFENPKDAVARIFEMLRPGGHLFVEVPSGRAWSVRLFGEGSGVFTDEHLFFHSAESLRLLLSTSGFEVLRINSVEGYPGLFNTALSQAGILRLANAFVAARRRRAPAPLAHAVDAPPPEGEALIDTGRHALAGAATIAGIAASPIRWALAASGLGGALFAAARKPSVAAANRRGI